MRKFDRNFTTGFETDGNRFPQVVNLIIRFSVKLSLYHEVQYLFLRRGNIFLLQYVRTVHTYSTYYLTLSMLLLSQRISDVKLLFINQVFLLSVCMYISERLWYSNKGRLCSESKCPSRELPRLPAPARPRTPYAEQPHPL